AACRGDERAAGCARDELPDTASLRSPHGPATAARYQTSRGSSLRNLDRRLVANREADAQGRDRCSDRQRDRRRRWTCDKRVLRWTRMYAWRDSFRTGLMERWDRR